MLFDLWGDYIQHRGGEVWTVTLTRYMAEFGISEPTLRQALSRMTRQGWLQVRRVATRSCYSLTERGQRRITEACRRVYDPVDLPWDGMWRILTYSIPESMRAKRDELRHELAWTGFAPLASGAWISPNPLDEAAQELIRRYEIESCVSTFLSRHMGPGTPKELVQRCWDLRAIQEGYDQFLLRWTPRLDLFREGRSLPDDRCFVEKLELVHDFRKFLFVDPGLPRELLPGGWRGLDARGVFQEYYGLLNTGANRFMDGAFQVVPDPAGGED
ncbi:MAG TPA: PaaX family transcriptional regulator C-terminal domain-containing protein [Symbiobacteriaceae bacterium]